MSSLLDCNDEMYSTKKDLFNYVMKGKWDKVVELYNDKPIAHKAKITKSGDTALHLAISEHQESVVEDLVKRIREKKNEDVLRIQNEIGCTPLHFAVSMGSVRMCKCILEADESLVEVQNNKGETPLFWSVLYGQKKRRCRRQNTDNCDDEVTNQLKYAYCRRTYDGETILQCAIIGEYFDLALDIIRRYEGLVNSRDTHGILPFQTLATKSSAFKIRVLVRGLSRFKFGVAEVRGRSLVFEFPSTFAFGFGVQVQAHVWGWVLVRFQLWSVVWVPSEVRIPVQDPCVGPGPRYGAESKSGSGSKVHVWGRSPTLGWTLSKYYKKS
ncbi:hypothetical protein F8388_025759 [Cannabis sativa]|uniref:Uncharacterized protein n=1 Tax=Cannabis sativa TaxID=3483 RepID=A0A7J6F9F1_CANSA|nr:hypothetical protein F8388_025759 [Cannabis sativa]